MSYPTFKPNMTRVDLAHMFKELGYRSGAEIGTARGDYAYTLCKQNPQAKIYCIDAWTTYEGYEDITDHEKMVHNSRKAQARLKQFNNVEIINDFSNDALDRFGDGSLDFVYIDANHAWPYITQDLYHWSKKVKPGGIVSGHDYLEELRPDGLCHVKSALLGYTDAFNIENWYVIGKPDRAQSWYWVQP